jgi:hypothetical protein
MGRGFVFLLRSPRKVPTAMIFTSLKDVGSQFCADAEVFFFRLICLREDL